MTEQKTSHPIDTQVQDLGNLDSQDPDATASSTLGQVVVSGLRLIPFEQKKGEEVPNLYTIFYDTKKKRIMKRSKRRIKGKLRPSFNK